MQGGGANEGFGGGDRRVGEARLGDAVKGADEGEEVLSDAERILQRHTLEVRRHTCTSLTRSQHPAL